MAATGKTRRRAEYRGPAIFSYGFRPFFLAAAIWAVLAMADWAAHLHFGIWIGPFAPVDWHVHELLFGYVSAAIAGFLYTAIPNWTGRMPIRGWPLAAMALLWLLGRVAMAWPYDLDPLAIAIVDAAFLFVMAAVVAREIAAGRNYRNLRVLAPIALLALANACFHAEVILYGVADYSIRLGFAAVLVLVALIGGRVTPSFTRNWLSRQGPGRLPAPFNRVDAVALALLAVAMLIWTALPDWVGAGVLLGLAGVAHLVRLGRWAGERTLSNILLFVLHFFYACLPLGLLALSTGILTDAVGFRIAGMHILGVGLIGGMTASVMSRATLGHTGRALASTPALTLAFALLAAATLTRVWAAFTPDGPEFLLTSACLWIAAFAVFLFAMTPWLVLEKRTKGGA